MFIPAAAAAAAVCMHYGWLVSWCGCVRKLSRVWRVVCAHVHTLTCQANGKACKCMPCMAHSQLLCCPPGTPVMHTILCSLQWRACNPVEEGFGRASSHVHVHTYGASCSA
jgi:hypothetical protein